MLTVYYKRFKFPELCVPPYNAAYSVCTCHLALSKLPHGCEDLGNWHINAGTLTITIAVDKNYPVSLTQEYLVFCHTHETLTD